MKIYQVEELVGITKKNIRFYEDQGLLCPERNPQNDYREYSLADVKVLEKIKLLRKLSVPIEEIRLLQKGRISFEQSMNAQLERLGKEEENVHLMKEFCQRLKDENCDLKSLDASFYLMEMDKMEKEGTHFIDIEKEDIMKKKKKGAILAAVIFCILMLLFAGILISTIIAKSAPLLPMIIPVIILLTIVIGIVCVLILRLREINKGEEYEARKY